MKDIHDIIAQAEEAMQGYPSNSSVALCLTYNVGDLNKSVYRIAFCQYGNRDAKPYYKLARYALADTILQARILAHRLGLDWDKLVSLGELRHLKTMKAVKRGERD